MGKIAINGFGRIGRVAYRILKERGLHQHVVAVNDLTDAPTLAYLLKYDSNYGVLRSEVNGEVFENKEPYSGVVRVDGHELQVLAVKEPEKLPWADLDIDVVIESTGRFTDEAGMRKHLQAGAKRVLLSAPVKDDTVPTIVRGVNESALGDQELVSNASCTTNCITPVAAVIAKAFGIEKVMMTTIHSYTASQAIQDAPNKDYREGRAAAENMVPTSTGATKAAAKALPELAGNFLGLSVRVPTAVGSLADFTFVTKKDATVEEVKAALVAASKETQYQGILEVTEDQIVLKDIVGNPASAIVDLSLTQVVGGNLVKVVAWYDNEWGYANRLIDQVVQMANLK